VAKQPSPGLRRPRRPARVEEQPPQGATRHGLHAAGPISRIENDAILRAGHAVRPVARHPTDVDPGDRRPGGNRLAL
jgi:hypothetical protein